MPDSPHTSPPSRGSAPADASVAPASTRAPGAGSGSIAARISVATVLVLAVVCGLVAVHLSRRERQRLVAAKTVAAEMVTDLFAASVSAAVDFDDGPAVDERLRALSGNPDVAGASVWSLAGDSLGELRGLPRRAPPGAPPARAIVGAREVEILRPAVTPMGTRVGTTSVRFSLARDLATFEATRQRILLVALGVCTALAALLVALVRHLVTTPIERLSRAAAELGNGRRTSVDVTSRDEIGNLGATFNQMALAIADREGRLATANERLQGVLDHMGQTIVVLGPGGSVKGVRSRLAEVTFRRELREGEAVLDLLFPLATATLVERAACQEWLEAAFHEDRPAWSHLLRLAPSEAEIEGTAGTTALELSFRPAPSDAGEHRIMLLATDVTERRNLERAVADKDREHVRQLASLRRLAAGGSQVFVRFAEQAELRLSQCALDLRAPLADRAGLERAFGVVHTLRTEAQCFELGPAEGALAEAERLLACARDEGGPGADTGAAVAAEVDGARLALSDALAAFVRESPLGRAVLDQTTVQRRDVERLQELLGSRQDEVGVVVAKLAARPFGECTLSLVDAFTRWNQEIGKIARLEIDGRETLVPRPLAQVLGGITGHLVRNALAHGIESATARESAGKPAGGLVRLSCRELPEGVEVVVEDDGGGFSAGALRKRRSAHGTPSGDGLADAFEAGLSTASASAVRAGLAGYGVGLGAVKEELATIGYSVRLSSTPGAGSRVTLAPGGAP